MALRLIEMVLREKDGDEVREHLKEHNVLDYRQVRLPDGEVLVRILLDVEQSESVLDFLEKRYADAVGNRVVILPVEATLPHPKPEPAASPEQSQPEEKPRGGYRSATQQRGNHHRGDGDCAVARAERGIVARHDVG
jgi:hypothetical protein